MAGKKRWKFRGENYRKLPQLGASKICVFGVGGCRCLIFRSLFIVHFRSSMGVRSEGSGSTRQRRWGFLLRPFGLHVRIRVHHFLLGNAAPSLSARDLLFRLHRLHLHDRWRRQNSTDQRLPGSDRRACDSGCRSGQVSGVESKINNILFYQKSSYSELHKNYFNLVQCLCLSILQFLLDTHFSCIFKLCFV